MEILVLCGIYVVELVCYRLGLLVLFDTRVKWDKCMIAGFVLPVLLGISSIYTSGKLVIITLFVILLNLFIEKEKLTEKVFKNIMVLVLTSCLNDVFETITENIIYVDKIVDADITIKYLLMESFALVVLIVVRFSTRRITKKKTHVSPVAYFIVGFAAMTMMSGLALLDYIMRFFNRSNLCIIFAILDVVVYINVILLVLFIVHIKKTNIQIEELLKSEKMLKNMQVNYYRTLLDKENDTRKYRHDMNNHFYYIQTLLNDKKYIEAKEYFEKLQGNFQNSYKRNYVIGNEMIDVIMNYFFGMFSENVVVEIIGRYTVKLAMEDIDVCTVFSNIFQNVLEAVEDDKNIKKNVEIYVRHGRSFVEYIIMNTFTMKNINQNSQNGNILVTHKKDKRNHGIGLKNVKEIVEKNGGNFSWEIKDNWFCVKVVLPILTV
ncbi:MAG: ATP-binding protein [Lachnospiraceae bacterium]|nr:ATP-binding protein [Lachnospiraceae bacterium]